MGILHLEFFKSIHVDKDRHITIELTVRGFF